MIKRFFLLLLCLAAALTVFSAAADNEDAVVNKYIFYVDGAVYKTAVLLTGDTLNQPENPAKADHRFAGWYADEALTTPYAGFGTSITADGSEIKIYAKFEKVFHIIYLDDQGRVLLTEEVLPNAEYTFSKDVPMFEPQPISGIPQVNDGWKDKTSGNPLSGAVTITQDLTVTPVLKAGYYARFFTQGGSFEPSQFLTPNQKVICPTEPPTRQGYAFAGWYTAATDGALFDFDVAPAGAVDIYAQWTPAEVEYTVAFWIENADDNDYTMQTPEIRHATVGSTVTYQASDVNKYGAVYFRLDTDKTKSVQVNADGSTILNIYYERAKFNFQFNIGSKKYYFNDIKYQQLVDVFYNGMPEFSVSGRASYPRFAIAPGRWITILPGLTLEHPYLSYYGFNGSRYGTTVIINVDFSNAASVIVYWYAEYDATIWPDVTSTHSGPDGKDYVLLRSSYYFTNVVERAYSLEGYTPKYLLRSNGRIENVTSSGQDFWVSGNNNRFYSVINYWDIIFDTKGGDAVPPVSHVMWSSPIAAYEPNTYKENDGIGIVSITKR